MNCRRGTSERSWRSVSIGTLVPRIKLMQVIFEISPLYYMASMIFCYLDNPSSLIIFGISANVVSINDYYMQSIHILFSTQTFGVTGPFSLCIFQFSSIVTISAWILFLHCWDVQLHSLLFAEDRDRRKGGHQLLEGMLLCSGFVIMLNSLNVDSKFFSVMHIFSLVLFAGRREVEDRIIPRSIDADDSDGDVKDQDNER